MNSISAQEDERLIEGGINLVHINFTADTGEKYDRWVDADKWDNNPDVIMAAVLTYMQSLFAPIPEATKSVNTPVLTMTVTQALKIQSQTVSIEPPITEVSNS